MQDTTQGAETYTDDVDRIIDDIYRHISEGTLHSVIIASLGAASTVLEELAIAPHSDDVAPDPLEEEEILIDCCVVFFESITKFTRSMSTAVRDPIHACSADLAADIFGDERCATATEVFAQGEEELEEFLQEELGRPGLLN